MTKEVDTVKSLKILHCNNISLGEIFLTFNSQVIKTEFLLTISIYYEADK